MGAPAWTAKDAGDKPWLQSKIPRYAELRDLGAARRKNPARDAYIVEVYEEYEKAFPGRVASFDLPGIGLGGTQVERKMKMIKRLNDWFGNILRDGVPGDGGKHDVLDLSGKQATLASRKEKKFEMYARLFKERLDPVLKTAYEDHVTECSKTDTKAQSEIAFRNSKLSEMLRSESEEVRKEVDAKQLTLADMNARSSPKWADEGEVGTEELERRRKAFALHKKLTMLTHTLERAGRTFRELGWNSVIVVGGPEPKLGGKVRVVGMTNGVTIPVGDKETGEVFEDYCGGWQKLMDDFLEFCNATTTVEEREALSLSLEVLPNQEKESVETADTPVPTSTTESSTPASTTEPNIQPSTTTRNQSQTVECNNSLTTTDDMLQSANTVFLDTGNDSGFLITKKFGDTLYKYYAPHNGTKLTLQQQNDNARAFNKALAVGDGLIAAAKAITPPTKAKKKADGGEKGCDEKGADTAVAENHRVTRAEARLHAGGELSEDVPGSVDQSATSVDQDKTATAVPLPADPQSTAPSADTNTPPTVPAAVTPDISIADTNTPPTIPAAVAPDISITDTPNSTTFCAMEINESPSTPDANTPSTPNANLATPGATAAVASDGHGAGTAVEEAGKDEGTVAVEKAGTVVAADTGTGAVGAVEAASKNKEAGAVEGADKDEGAGAGQGPTLTASEPQRAISVPATPSTAQATVVQVNASVPANVLSPRDTNTPDVLTGTLVDGKTARKKRQAEVDVADICEGSRKRTKVNNRYGIH